VAIARMQEWWRVPSSGRGMARLWWSEEGATSMADRGQFQSPCNHLFKFQIESCCSVAAPKLLCCVLCVLLCSRAFLSFQGVPAIIFVSGGGRRRGEKPTTGIRARRRT
jgi:hypothetical protein